VTLPVLLDDFDHRLLALLQDDAARTLTTLGEAVGLSPSAVQRRLTRYRKHGLMQQVAVLNPEAFPALVLATVWVAMERESVRMLNAFYARMRAAPEVQQCYQLAGEWDYLVIMATTSVAAYREAAERLFKIDGNIKRYETRLVFDTVKRSLRLPTQASTTKPRRRG
jgi:Lrp/AsnC family leucine-responsive transcriptional regulator